MLNKTILCLRKVYKKNKYIIGVKFMGSKNKILEKIGTYDIIHRKLVINPFRLIFFISRGVSMTGSLLLILKRYKLFNKKNFKNEKRFKIPIYKKKIIKK